MRDDFDWSVLDIEGVSEALTFAARSVARHEKYAEYVEYDDLRQEASIIAAHMPDRVRDCAGGVSGHSLGTLKHEIEMDLIDKVKTDVQHRQDHESYEARYEADTGDEGYAPRPANLAVREDTSAYTRELVEALLPAVWDETYCYGIRMENAPDSDMPRGWTNKATGNTLAAHIADIKAGWKNAPLTLKERRALILGYGLDWKVTEIAYNQEVSHQAISARLATGVGKIVNTLNGKDDPAWYHEDENA